VTRNPKIPSGRKEDTMAPRDPMGECTKSGRTALGVWANDPKTVELCAFLGLD